MTFGTSIAAYNNKKPLTVPAAPGTTTTPAVDTTSAQQVAQPFNGSQKTALSGSTGPVASGFVNPIQTNPVQPIYSGQMGSKSDSIYGRLNAINSMTDSQNELQAARTNAANNRISNWNSRLSDYQNQYGGGDDSGLDSEQLDNAKAIANIGRARGFTDQGIQIALMTALTESGLRNLNHGDRDSLGLFQQRPSQGWGSAQQVTNREYSAGKFYDALGKVNYGGMNPWAAAQSVQRSFDPTGGNYQKQWQLAQRAYGSLNKQAASGTPNAASSWINAFNNRYVDYDGQFGAQCVDLYDFYTSGFVGGKPVMVGMAPEIFNNYDANAYKRFGNNIPGRMGDVAVFRPGGATPSGHVAIVVGDNGNGTLRVLQANATPAGSRGNTIISNISKASLMGYLRPNKLGA